MPRMEGSASLTPGGLDKWIEKEQRAGKFTLDKESPIQGEEPQASGIQPRAGPVLTPQAKLLPMQRLCPPSYFPAQNSSFSNRSDWNGCWNDDTPPAMPAGCLVKVIRDLGRVTARCLPRFLQKCNRSKGRNVGFGFSQLFEARTGAFDGRARL